MTALHFAVSQEHEDIVELLLEANADPDLIEVITITTTVQSTEINVILSMINLSSQKALLMH